MYNIHTSGIKNKEYANVSKQLELLKYYSVNQQNMEGVQNRKWLT